MKLIKVVFIGSVNCGGHKANTCADCPVGKVAHLKPSIAHSCGNKQSNLVAAWQVQIICRLLGIRIAGY